MRVPDVRQTAVPSPWPEASRLGRTLRDLQLLALAPARREVFVALLDRFVDLLDRTMPGRNYNDLPEEAKECWQQLVRAGSESDLVPGAALLAHLLVKSPERAAGRSIPPVVIQQFSLHFERIGQGLVTPPAWNYSIENDVFLKDLGICRLEIFPCISLLVDKRCGIPRRLAFRHGPGQAARFATLMVTTRGVAPFFEIHAHLPMMHAFHPDGWDSCYHVVAELLRLYPDHRGLIGSSWFFDPEVVRISPHLGYMRLRAEARGAIFLCCGSSPADIANATVRSKLRRRLYEEGKYLPTSYMMVWPRRRLIAWSESILNGTRVETPAAEAEERTETVRG